MAKKVSFSCGVGVGGVAAAQLLYTSDWLPGCLPACPPACLLELPSTFVDVIKLIVYNGAVRLAGGFVKLSFHSFAYYSPHYPATFAIWTTQHWNGTGRPIINISIALQRLIADDIPGQAEQHGRLLVHRLQRHPAHSQQASHVDRAV